MVKKTKRRNSHQSKRRKTLKRRYKRNRVSHKRKNKSGGMMPAGAMVPGEGRVEDLNLKPLNEVYPIQTIDFLDQLYVKESKKEKFFYASEKEYLKGKIDKDTLKKNLKKELIEDYEDFYNKSEFIDEMMNDVDIYGVREYIDSYKIEAGKLGSIEAHGATIADSKKKPMYTKVPLGLNLILLNPGGKGKYTRKPYDVTINYPEGSLIEDYYLEFNPTYTDKEWHTTIRAVGVYGNEEINSYEHTKLQNLLENIQHHRVIDKRMSTEDVKRENIKDDYGIIAKTPPMTHLTNANGYYIYSLSSILRTISENLATNPQLPKYYACSFCRDGTCDVYGTDALSKCNTDGLPTIPENIFDTDTNESLIDLRRQSSLSGSNALRYFTSIIKELIDYGNTHHMPWLNELQRLNEKYTYIYEEVCYILQLRVSLAL